MRNRSQYATVGVIDAATLAMDIKEVRALATTRQPSKHCPVMLPREEHLSETHWYRFAQKFAYYRTGVAYHRWYRKNYRDIVDFTATADDFEEFYLRILDMYWEFPSQLAGTVEEMRTSVFVEKGLPDTSNVLLPLGENDDELYGI